MLIKQELKNTLQAEREKVLKESTASMFLKEKHEMEIEQLKSVLDVGFKITDFYR